MKRFLIPLVLPLLLVGCVDRLLVIRSEPSGADAFLDGQRVGQTPVTVSYEHYGTREVTLAKPGFKTYRKLLPLHTPWWQFFPFDFFTELILPFTFEDKVEIDIPLEKEPDAAVSFQETLKRADEARQRAEAK